MNNYAITPKERDQILSDARTIVDAACMKFPQLISRPVPPSRKLTRGQITASLHDMEVGEIILFSHDDAINVRTAVHFANGEETETRWTTVRNQEGTIEVRRLLRPSTATKTA